MIKTEIKKKHKSIVETKYILDYKNNVKKMQKKNNQRKKKTIPKNSADLLAGVERSWTVADAESESPGAGTEQTTFLSYNSMLSPSNADIDDDDGAQKEEIEVYYVNVLRKINVVLKICIKSSSSRKLKLITLGI